MTRLIGTRLGPYEIEDLVGAGGMGEVYRARDPRLGREVAIKVLPSEVAADSARLALFEREARAVAALNHPNILTVHDVGTDDGTLYVVTELLEGETLRELVSRRVPTTSQILSYMLQAARGLEAAHAKGIVHRDLKPENLFLTTDGRVKVLDFGLAKLVRSEAEITSDISTAAHSTPPGQVAGTVLYMSPEQARAQTIDVRSDVFSYGVVLYELLAGKHPFRKDTVAGTLTAIVEETPVDLESLGRRIPPAVAGIVRRCLEKAREDRYSSGHDVAMVLEAVLAAPSGARALEEVEERSPYPGLSSFSERDAAVFFGREREVEGLWGRIPNRKLLAVIGPSGAGKTSFVRAGVLAARPEGWAVLVCAPGRAPLRALARALAPELAGDPEALTALPDFEDEDVALSLLRRWRRPHAEALLVIDQLEELFTLSSVEEQERFSALLGRLAAEGDVHVLLSLRDDFLMKCHDREPLAPVFSELTPLGPLTPEGLHRALVEPAKKQGYRFEEDALIEEMVESVEGARAALPLLAFAVSRLWEKRDREDKALTRAAYEEIGGVAGALAQHAEQTLDRIGSERQGMVREIFRNLVTSQGTRAAADREELLSVFPEREAAEQVLGELIDARLLTSYETEDSTLSSRGASSVERATRDLLLDGSASDSSPAVPSGGLGMTETAATTHRIEIVHESLLKAWPRLVRWQAQDEEGAVLRDQLKQAAHVWEEKGRSPDVLWSGTALREYELWRERYAGKLTVVEESFAGAMLEHDRRRRRWRRALVTALVAGLAIVAVVVSLSRQEAVRQAQRAAQETQRAEAGKLLALAQVRLGEDPTEALALTTASLTLADTPEARLLAVRTLTEAPPAIEVAARQRQMRGATFSPGGEWLAAVGRTDKVLVWSSMGDGPVVLPGQESTPAGASSAEWLDSETLATGLCCGLARQVHVWSLPSGDRLRTIEFGVPSDWIAGTKRRVLAATPEGTDGLEGLHRLLQAGPQNLLLRSWDVDDGQVEVLGRVAAAAPGVDKVSLEPNGRGWIFAKGREVYLRRLGAEVGAPDLLLARHGQAVEDLDYLPRTWTDRLVSRDMGGETRIWSFPPEGPSLERVIARPDGAPKIVLAEPSGRWLLGPIWQERKARVWDTESLPGARPLQLRRTGLWSSGFATFQPGGSWLVAGTHDTSRLTLWPLPEISPVVVDGYGGYGGMSRPLAFSPDSRWLLTRWSHWTGGVIRLWPLPGGEPQELGTLTTQGTVDLAFDPHGRYVVRLAPLRGPELVPLAGSPARELSGATEADTQMYRVAVSPRGRRVATAFYHGKAKPSLYVWDVETEDLRVFTMPPSASTTLDAGYRGGVGDLHFTDESTLFTSGDGGLRRWDVDTGVFDEIWVPKPQEWLWTSMSAEGHVALTRSSFLDRACETVELHIVASGEHRSLPDFGDCVTAHTIDPAGHVAATGEQDGTVRVGRLSGGLPHILGQHEGPVDRIAVSPDLRWVASSGDDSTLRLWPMPNLDRPPLHTLPHDDLIAKLKSLTNIRAARDPESSTGWTIELGPFPGWKDVPEW